MLDQIVEYVNYKEEFIFPTMPLKDRLLQPMPGDPIDWGNAYGEYPYPILEEGPVPTKIHGRIAETFYYGYATKFLCCVTLGNAFLGVLHKKTSPHIYCSISGGPFVGILQINLIYSGENRYVPFWNWKKGGAQANNAYHFNLMRPIWLLK